MQVIFNLYPLGDETELHYNRKKLNNSINGLKELYKLYVKDIELPNFFSAKSNRNECIVTFNDEGINSSIKGAIIDDIKHLLEKLLYKPIVPNSYSLKEYKVHVHVNDNGTAKSLGGLTNDSNDKNKNEGRKDREYKIVEDFELSIGHKVQIIYIYHVK